MIAKGKEKDFEKALLGYVEMVYAVALSLTHNPGAAQRLARTTVVQVWEARGTMARGVPLNMCILALLRAAFLAECQRTHLVETDQARVTA